MIVIPLGLGTKLRWAPVITMGIIVLWIGNFIFDPFQTKISQDLNVAAAQSGIKDSSRKLFIEYCLKARGLIRKCDAFSQLIWAGFPAKTKIRDLPKLKNLLGKEYEKSVNIKASLKECADSSKPKSCLKYKEIFWKFSKAIQTPTHLRTGIISGLPSYDAYTKASADFGRRMVRACQANQCLIKGNIKIQPILLAQIRHGSLLHLLGNLVAFLIFGSYVEQRLRPVQYGAVLMTAGSLGMFFHVLNWGTYDSFIIGGSTIASGALGLFYALFFNKDLCLRVLIPRKLYFGTNFYVPIKYAVPMMFIMGDIAGGLNSGYNEFGLPRVAHFAHLSSFGIGALLGALLMIREKAQSHPLYRHFQEDYGALKSAKSPGTTLVLADQILACDPHQGAVSLFSLQAYFGWLTKSQTHSSRNPLLKEIGKGAERFAGDGDRFCKRHLPKLLDTFCKRQSHLRDPTEMVTLKALVRLFDQIPSQVNISRYLFDSPPDTVLKVAISLLNSGAFFHGIRFFDLYLTLYPESKIVDDIRAFSNKTISDFFMSLHSSVQLKPSFDHRKLIEFFHDHPPSPIKAILEPYMTSPALKLESGANP